MTSLSLDSLASAINAAHERVTIAYRTALDDAKSAGELLLQAKAQVTHGEWTIWIARNVKFSDRTAQRYMQIASSWDSLQSKTATVADLGVRMACEMIAGDSQLNKQDMPPGTKSASSSLIVDPGTTFKKPKIRPGDRIKVTDESSPEYGQELEVSEVVQNAIALFKKDGETYPLLVNQVEVVERPTPPLQPSSEGIKPIPKGGNLERLPQKSLALYEPPKNNNDGEEQMRIQQEILGKSILSQNSRHIQSTNTTPITVAALQDVLRRILDECEEYLPQELIDEARELL